MPEAKALEAEALEAAAVKSTEKLGMSRPSNSLGNKIESSWVPVPSMCDSEDGSVVKAANISSHGRPGILLKTVQDGKVVAINNQPGIKMRIKNGDAELMQA